MSRNSDAKGWTFPTVATSNIVNGRSIGVSDTFSAPISRQRLTAPQAFGTSTGPTVADVETDIGFRSLRDFCWQAVARTPRGGAVIQQVSHALTADHEHPFFFQERNVPGDPFAFGYDADHHGTRIIDGSEPRGRVTSFSTGCKVTDGPGQDYSTSIPLGPNIGRFADCPIPPPGGGGDIDYGPGTATTGTAERQDPWFASQVQDAVDAGGASAGLVWDAAKGLNGMMSTFWKINPCDEVVVGRDGTPNCLLSARIDAHFDACDMHGMVRFVKQQISQGPNQGRVVLGDMVGDPSVANDVNSSLNRESVQWRPAIAIPFIVSDEIPEAPHGDVVWPPAVESTISTTTGGPGYVDGGRGIGSGDARAAKFTKPVDYFPAGGEGVIFGPAWRATEYEPTDRLTTFAAAAYDRAARNSSRSFPPPAILMPVTDPYEKALATGAFGGRVCWVTPQYSTGLFNAGGAEVTASWGQNLYYHTTVGHRAEQFPYLEFGNSEEASGGWEVGLDDTDSVTYGFRVQRVKSGVVVGHAFAPMKVYADTTICGNLEVKDCPSGWSARFDIDTEIFDIDGAAQHAKGADVASANDLTIAAILGRYRDVTGTTSIQRIANDSWGEGDLLILQFDSSLTVEHGVAAGGEFSSLLLEGALDMLAQAGSTLTLVKEASAWREISRSFTSGGRPHWDKITQITVADTPYQASVNEMVVVDTASGGGGAVTVLAPSSPSAGVHFAVVIKDNTNTTTLSGNGDNVALPGVAPAATISMVTLHEWVTPVSDGTQWYIGE